MDGLGQKLTDIPTLLLIDGDVFLYKTLQHVEHEHHWCTDISTLHVNENEAISAFADLVESVSNRCGDQHSIIIAFSDKNSNFRKDILPSYKANRVGRRKPLFYKGLKEWAMQHYTSIITNSLEADDVLGIYATAHLALSDNKAIIVSNDKDMNSIECIFYNIDTDIFTDVSKKDANYFKKLQSLSGDSADNYKGCKNVGAITAKKILDKNNSWDCVEETFLNAKTGHDYDYMMQQIRVAHLLDVNHYDFHLKKPILFDFKMEKKRNAKPELLSNYGYFF